MVLEVNDLPGMMPVCALKLNASGVVSGAAACVVAAKLPVTPPMVSAAEVVVLFQLVIPGVGGGVHLGRTTATFLIGLYFITL